MKNITLASQNFFPAVAHPDWREECGVAGVLGHRQSAHLVYLGLTSLQHRGQESAGIVSFEKEKIKTEKNIAPVQVHRHVGMGLVFDVFKKENIEFLRGETALGHVRYSTTGGSILENAQPLLVSSPYGQIAIGHNGNLTNADILRKALQSEGVTFQTTTDSEVLIHLIARSKEKNLVDAIVAALKKVEGAYSLLIGCSKNLEGKNKNILIAVRDPLGFRPLILGNIKRAWVLASETCAFDLIGAKSVREIDPGELLVLEEGAKPRTFRIAEKTSRSAFCIFEFIYFARPDSKIFGASVYEIRREMGRQLAREAPMPQADCVIAVPDSAVVAAIGYAEQMHLPFEIGFIRSHYVGRTFIEPSKPMRDFRAKIKYNPIKENLLGKSIVLIDDSIVRGTTSKKLIRMLKDAGVREIHLRISSPPIIDSCYYGIDTPTRAELIASTHSVEEIRKFLGVTSLRYLSVEGMVRSARGDNNKFCTACFSGKYPLAIRNKKK